MFKLLCLFSISIVLLWIIREKSTTTFFVKRLRPKKKVSLSPSMLSYNIQRLPISLKPLQSLQYVVRDHSIVLFQECFLHLLYDDIEYIFPDYHIIKGTMNGYRLVNSGLAILSKYPVIQHEFIPFKTQHYLSTDVFAEKGFIVALLQIGSKQVYFINTHLQSNTIKDDYSVAIQQWDQLYKYVSTLKYPWIIGGDFNINYSILQPLVSPYQLYAPLTPTIYILYKDEVEQYTSCTYQPGYNSYVFDYFITNQMELDIPETIPFLYSDHLPVMTTVKKN